MKTIMYLDDSIIALKIMEKTLSGFADLIAIPTISKALKAISKYNIHCFIIDQVLADGYGIDFAKKIRADEKYRKTPILLISASLTEAVAYNAMMAGINQSISKPIQPEEIRQILSQQLKNPTIQKVKRTKISACCVKWEAENKHFEYSLDTGRIVQGNSTEETREKMLTTLKTHIKSDFKEIIQTEIVNYFL